jgi:hypothetical protein
MAGRTLDRNIREIAVITGDGDAREASYQLTFGALNEKFTERLEIHSDDLLAESKRNLLKNASSAGQIPLTPRNSPASSESRETLSEYGGHHTLRKPDLIQFIDYLLDPLFDSFVHQPFVNLYDLADHGRFL